jgi:hypothetical protein
MKEDKPYSRAEVAQYTDKLPERGLLCPKCGARIPQFADLSDADRFRIRQLISHQQRMLAIAELRAATGCSLEWAKLWVYHSGRPEWDVGATTSCPYCGKPLRTPVAKQCRHCRSDWHDPNRVVKLGSQ